MAIINSMKTAYKFEEIREKIVSGADKLVNPIRQTLTPLGGNVLFTRGNSIGLSNDGITIAEQIESSDPIEELVIKTIRQASIKTNSEVGDGTTTTAILTAEFIKEGMRLRDSGWLGIEIKRGLDEAKSKLVEKIDGFSTKVKTDDELKFVARVSSNSDDEIADNTLKAIKVAGEDGLIVVEGNNKPETEVKIEDGYFLDSPMLSPMLANMQGRAEAQYKNVKVLVTDKRIYYPKEVGAILEPLAKAGITEVVIVARDFLGSTPNLFITNHVQKRMNILLVKDTNATDTNIESLEDLATYLGCSVITDKAGKMTTGISIEDFGTADRVISNLSRTVFYGNSGTRAKLRVKMLREEIDRAKDDSSQKDELKKRLARLTTGAVTVMVGGSTQTEMSERAYRYEDAINACRAAMKDGYVAGGGVTLMRAYNKFREENSGGIAELIGKVCSSPLKQIASNCGLYLPQLMEEVEKGRGYNANTGKYTDLKKAGIIEPTMATKSSFLNALSAASAVLSSNYFIVDVKEEKEDNKTNVR